MPVKRVKGTPNLLKEEEEEEKEHAEEGKECEDGEDGTVQVSRVRRGAVWVFRDAPLVDRTPATFAAALKGGVDAAFQSPAVDKFVSPLICGLSDSVLPPTFVQLAELLEEKKALVLLLRGPEGLDINLGASGVDMEVLRALLAPVVNSAARDHPVVVVCGNADWVTFYRQQCYRNSVAKRLHELVLVREQGKDGRWRANELPWMPSLAAQGGEAVARGVQRWYNCFSKLLRGKLGTDGSDTIPEPVVMDKDDANAQREREEPRAAEVRAVCVCVCVCVVRLTLGGLSRR